MMLPLDNTQKKFIMQIVATFQYYKRAIYPTIHTVLSALVTEAAPTTGMLNKIQHFLDCCTTQEEAVITYKSSDMKLFIHSVARYLNETMAHSRAGGYHFLTNHGPNPPIMEQYLMFHKSSNWPENWW